MPKILCSIATRGRYDSTLPLVLNAVINQTRLPDKLIIFDDNDKPQDLRQNFIYQHFFNILTEKKIDWEVRFAPKKGQHHIHQIANTSGFEWVWRVDDDCIPEPNVLENLASYILPNVGAIGGAILTGSTTPVKATGWIEEIDNEPNVQWGYVTRLQRVQHLHCSFLYRAGIADYHTGLSRVAHREETLFTYALVQKGFDLFVIPNANSWHMKNPQGGIRSEKDQQLFAHDEFIFRNLMDRKDKTIVVLDAGMGDHIVFNHVLSCIKNPEIYTCYPEITPGLPISEAYRLFGDLSRFNIYGKMDQWRWTSSLEEAYRKLYT